MCEIADMRARTRNDIVDLAEMGVELIDQGAHLGRKLALEPIFAACAHFRQRRPNAPHRAQTKTDLDHRRANQSDPQCAERPSQRDGKRPDLRFEFGGVRGNGEGEFRVGAGQRDRAFEDAETMPPRTIDVIAIRPIDGSSTER